MAETPSPEVQENSEVLAAAVNDEVVPEWVIVDARLLVQVGIKVGRSVVRKQTISPEPNGIEVLITEESLREAGRWVQENLDARQESLNSSIARQKALFAEQQAKALQQAAQQAVNNGAVAPVPEPEAALKH